MECEEVQITALLEDLLQQYWSMEISIIIMPLVHIRQWRIKGCSPVKITKYYHIILECCYSGTVQPTLVTLSGPTSKPFQAMQTMRILSSPWLPYLHQ